MLTLIWRICISFFGIFSSGIVQLHRVREMSVSANRTRPGRWILKSKRIIPSHKYLHLGDMKEQARQLQWIGLTWLGLVVIAIIVFITTWSRGRFIKKRNKKCRISRSYRMMKEQLRDVNIKLISHLEHQEMDQQQHQAEQIKLHQLLAQREQVNSEKFAIITKENQELKEILQNLNMNLLQVQEVAHQHQKQNEEHKMKEQQFHEKQEETNKQCENLARANKDLNEEVQQLKNKLVLLEEQQKQQDHENVQEHNLNMEESLHNNSPGALRRGVDTPNQEGFHCGPDLLKQFYTLLSEMTQDNFHHLLPMTMALNVTYRHFESVVQMIVCQAVARPKHSAVYASLCQHLNKIEVPKGDTPGPFEPFHQILLKQCEEEYSKSLAGISYICDIKSVEASSLVNEDELSTLLKSRKCSLGIIRFIGELYKLGVVTTTIIVHILLELFRDGRNQSVEYICCLLNTVGKELTSDVTDNVMDEYFHHLESIVKEGKLSARILSILRRFIFHRKRNWVPLRQ